jgi:Carboxypeptidase regulatory-like domain
MRRIPILAAAILALVTPSLARAQTSSGALEGTVRDTSSGVISGASVAVSGDRLIGGERKTETDAAGHFRITELSPGPYAISVSQPGFSTVRRDRVELPAGSTVVVDFTLAVGPVSDTVRIVAPSPMVDVTSAAPSQSIGETFLRELPTTRVSASLINLLPGVANDVAFGGTAGSNAIAADGLDITEAAQQAAFLRFDQNWVQEMQVASVGAGASAGGFTGLSANLVLKSGSNRLSGLGEFWFTNPSWVSTNTGGGLPADQRSAISPRTINRMWDTSVQAGFPLLRDRLWAFAGFRHSTLDDRPFGFSGSAVSQTNDSLYLLKLSSAPASRVRLEGFVQAGRFRQAAANIGMSYDDTALADVTKPETSWNLRATWTPFERTLVEGRYGGFDGSNNIVAHPPNTCSGPPAHYERTTGRWSGNFYQCQQTSQRRHNGSLSLTQTLGALAGTHELKAGVEFDRSHRVDAYNYPGGLYYIDNNGAPNQAMIWPGGSETSDTGRTGAYVSDRWQVASRLTLLPGVRVDFGDGSIPGQPGIFATAAVSPRIGAAFDVGADHRTVLRAHVGRYVDPVFAQRVADADSSNWPPLVMVQVVGPNQFVELFRSGGQGGYVIDPDIRHSHVDEVIVGAERQIAARVSVQVQFVRRRFRDFMGLVDPGSRYSPVIRADSGPDGVAGTADDGGPLTVYALQGSDGSPWLYTNPAGASRRYDAAQVVVRSHGTRFGQFQASYTWSRSEGNVGNQAGTNAGLGDLGSPGNYNNPNLLINADGRLFYDPTHELKLLGTSHIPLWGGMNVSAVYRYVTGNPWCRLVWVTGLPQGWSRVRVEPRGARRLDATSILDLRIEQVLRVPGRAKVSLLLEALNLANFGAATSVTEISGPNFGWPMTWTDPRIVRLGLRVKF